MNPADALHACSLWRGQRLRPRPAFLLLTAFVLLLLGGPAKLPAQIQSPKEFLGFRPGIGRKLAEWKQIIEYFKTLEQGSDRVRLEILGESTEGRPLAVALISSANNLRNLALLKNYQRQAAHPAHLSDEDIDLLASRSKAFVAIALQADSKQNTAAQGAFEIGYSLASSRESGVESALGAVVLLLVLSTNPDGVDRVSAWSNRYVGTPFEGSLIPERSHSFAGDDVASDWTFLRTVETRTLTREVLRRWAPEVVAEIGGFDSVGSRFLLTGAEARSSSEADTSSAGGFTISSLSAALQAQGLQGMEFRTVAPLSATGTLATSAATHNAIGLKLEVANTQYASPLYFPHGSVLADSSADSRVKWGKSWEGGWWRPGDFIEYEVAFVESLLRSVAAGKERIVRAFCLANRAGIQSGAESDEAFVIPQEQASPTAAVELLRLLHAQGVEVLQATSSSGAGQQALQIGDFVIPGSQPLANEVFRMMKGQIAAHPSVSGGTVPIWKLFGVASRQVKLASFEGLKRTAAFVPGKQAVRKEGNGDFVIDHADNQSFLAVNRILGRKKKVYWIAADVVKDGERFERGAIVLPRQEMPANQVNLLAQELALNVRQSRVRFQGEQALRLKEPRVGCFQPWFPEADPGWTQHLLEMYGFRSEAIYGLTVSKQDLSGKYDAVILPDLPVATLLDGWSGVRAAIARPAPPRPYLAGIGEAGMLRLSQFVRKGGTLIALGRSCRVVVEKLNLPVDILPFAASPVQAPPQFFELVVDTTEPLSFGMAETVIAAFTAGPVLRPRPWVRRVGVAATFTDSSRLAQSRLNLGGLPAVLEFPEERGRIVLIPVRPQFRAQTGAALKLLFNAIQLSRSELVVVR